MIHIDDKIVFHDSRYKNIKEHGTMKVMDNK